MTKKGVTRSLKSMHAPAFWPVHVKEFKWVTKPSPGPHPIEESLPLSIIIRDILKYGKSTRETNMILSEEKVRVDGKIRRDKKFPVGLMDIIEISDAKKAYRVLPFPGKGLTLVDIPDSEKTQKLCRIEDKTFVKGGNVQVNLHDGRNVLVKIKDPKKPKEDEYKTLDTLQIKIPEQEILKHFAFKEGSYALITSGRNIGKSGKIIKIEKSAFAKPSIVTMEDDKSNEFQTIADYVFIIGDEKPLIKLSE
jgi:small subunit ribosomal protein S4e